MARGALWTAGKSVYDDLIRAGYPEGTAKKIASGELPMDEASRMARAGDQGYNKGVFHSTYADIDEIDPDLVDLGLHTGGVDQATQRLRQTAEQRGGYRYGDSGYAEGANIMPLMLREGTTVDAPDVGMWNDAERVISETPMWGNGALYDEALDIKNSYETVPDWHDSKENRQMLDEVRDGLDADTVRYKNEVESTNTFRPEIQQRRAEIGDEILFLEQKYERPELPVPATEENIQEYIKWNLDDVMSPEDKKAIERLKAESMQITSGDDAYVDQNSYIALKPENVRSKYAAFDPDNVGKKNILGSLAAPTAAGALGAGLLASPEEAEAGPVDRLGRRMIEAWHGSPHKFDKFSMDNIGTGEGAQAYGHGLYFADSEDVAKGYRDMLKEKNPSALAELTMARLLEQNPDAPFSKNAIESGIHRMNTRGYSPREAMDDLYGTFADDPGVSNLTREKLDEAIGAIDDTLQDQGALYRTQLDVDPDTLLDWDGYLADQPQKIQDEFAKYADERGMAQETRDKFRGEHIYERLGNSADSEKGSQLLLDKGINGIRYKDGMSRGNEGGTHNYVMFDDKPISITERGNADPRLLAGIAAGTGALGAGMLMSPDDAMAGMQDEGILGGIDTALGMAGDVAQFATAGGYALGEALQGRDATDAFTEATEDPIYKPQTMTADAVTKLLGDTAGALMDYKPPLRDQTIGQELGQGMKWLSETGRPWLAENIGEYGTNLLEGAGLAAMGVLGNKKKGPIKYDDDLARASRTVPPLQKTAAGYLDSPRLADIDPSNPPSDVTQVGKKLGLLRKPAVRTRENYRSGGGESIFEADQIPERTIVQPEDMVGHVLTPLTADITRGGGRLTQVGGVPLSRPVTMRGGPEFGQTDDAWASEYGAASSQQAKVNKAAQETGLDPIQVYRAMSPEGSNFSHHVAKALLGQMDNLPISKSAKNDFDRYVRRDAKPSARIEDFVGLDSDALYDQVLGVGDFAGTPAGEIRKRLIESMRLASFRDSGFPIYDDALDAVNNPALRDLDVGDAGYALIRGEPGGLLTPSDHLSYDTKIPGSYMGGLEHSYPSSIMFPKSTKKMIEQGLTNMPRSFQMAHWFEEADDEWLDGILSYRDQSSARE